MSGVVLIFAVWTRASVWASKGANYDGLCVGDSEYGSPEPSKFVSSPKPEKSCPFVRQPPDGCEKVKVIEDTR